MQYKKKDFDDKVKKLKADIEKAQEDERKDLDELLKELSKNNISKNEK